jgi:hypothetical protein
LFDRLAGERGPSNLPDLLEPYYYLSPELDEGTVFKRLREVALTQPNWIFEDPPPEYFKLAERLRARGVVGPLWAYFALLQRFGRSVAGQGQTVGNG